MSIIIALLSSMHISLSYCMIVLLNIILQYAEYILLFICSSILCSFRSLRYMYYSFKITIHVFLIAIHFILYCCVLLNTQSHFPLSP
ncbi:hypothetical protein BDF19DRAFT_184761 [Syncephalis fuscata]|nr:hypothetical protein BDF19DRAFT_184761 [Syncephalis fuscata]